MNSQTISPTFLVCRPGDSPMFRSALSLATPTLAGRRQVAVRNLKSNGEQTMTTHLPVDLMQNLLTAANNLTLNCWRYDSYEDEYAVAESDMEALCVAVSHANQAVLSSQEQENVVRHAKRLHAAGPALYDFVHALAEPFPEEVNFWDWFDDVQAHAQQLVREIEVASRSKFD